MATDPLQGSWRRVGAPRCEGSIPSDMRVVWVPCTNVRCQCSLASNARTCPPRGCKASVLCRVSVRQGNSNNIETRVRYEPKAAVSTTSCCGLSVLRLGQSDKLLAKGGDIEPRFERSRPCHNIDMIVTMEITHPKEV
eukprot:6224293-Amphidinium_carterae.1